MPTYSLVVPAYNEEGVIEELVAHLGIVMDALDGDSEAILVDDGSRDRTWELMQQAAKAAADPARAALAQLRPSARADRCARATA